MCRPCRNTPLLRCAALSYAVLHCAHAVVSYEVPSYAMLACAIHTTIAPFYATLYVLTVWRKC